MRELLLIIAILVFHLSSMAQKNTVYHYSAKEWDNINTYWANKNIKTNITTVEGTILKGQLIALDGQELIFYADEDLFFDLSSNQANFQRIPISEIEEIEYWDLYTNRKSTKQGTLIGGAIGLGASLLFYAAFQGWVAPFIIPLGTVTYGGMGAYLGNNLYLVKDYQSLQILSVSEEEKTRMIREIAYFSEYSLLTQEGLGLTQMQNHASHLKKVFKNPRVFVNVDVNNFFSNYAYENKEKPREFIFGVGAGVRITERITAEYKFRNRFIPLNEFGQEDIEGYYYYKGLSDIVLTENIFYANYKLITHDGTLNRKIELSAGAGFGLNHFSTWYNYYFTYGTSPDIDNESHEFTIDQRSTAFHLKTELSYYVFKRCSAYLYVDKSFRAKVPIEEHIRIHPDLGLRLGYEAQNMNLSSVDVIMGIRLHLF